MDYVEAFKNLRTNNKYGRKSPHKAVLMLTVIEMYEKNIITDNEIYYDDSLKSMFLKVWNKVLPNESRFHPEAYLPFWYLQNDSFWHILPVRGKEDILSLMRDTNIKPSEAKLNDSVRCAELDDDLYFLMTIASGRSSLKRALLETYTNLPEEKVKWYSISLDNTVDHSASAMDEYEQILLSKNSNETVSDNEITTELEKQFKELSDDLQIALSYEYFAFLKNHRSERGMLREICPNVYALYDCIVNHPTQRTDVSPSSTFIYDNFLCDLKIALMSENDSMELIDKIDNAIAILHGDTIEKDDVDKHFDFLEGTNAEQLYEIDGEQAPLLPSKDEQHPSNLNYTIENQNKRCYIIDNFGEKVFSSSGKLIIIDEEIYRVCYTNTNINMHLVKKDERGMYTLGKRVLSVRVYSPLYSVLDEMDNIDQIKAVRFDRVNEEYHVLVGDRWYGSSGYYADLADKESENKKSVEETNPLKPADSAEKDLHDYDEYTFDDMEVEHVYLDSSNNIVKTVTTSSPHESQEKEEIIDSRKGKAWTQEEEKRITHYFERGINTAEIAERIGRTEAAIKARLAKLGLIEYTYGQDESDAESLYFVPINPDDFQIENGYTKTNIFNKHGEKVFTDEGKLKFIREKLYRLKLQNQCFTIKGMRFNGEVWMKGGKKVVAYPQTALYKIMDGAKDYSEVVEDLYDGASFQKCKVKVNGCWYDNQGDLIIDSSIRDDATEVSPPKHHDNLKIIKHPLYAVRKQALLRAMGYFRLPAKIRDIARTISRTAWGAPIKEDEVKEIISTLSEIDSVDGKYILRRLNKEKKASNNNVSTPYNEKDIFVSPPNSKVNIGNWIQCKSTGVVGKVVRFKKVGNFYKIIIQTKTGEFAEVNDDPKVYEKIK